MPLARRLAPALLTHLVLLAAGCAGDDGGTDLTAASASTGESTLATTTASTAATDAGESTSEATSTATSVATTSATDASASTSGTTADTTTADATTGTTTTGGAVDQLPPLGSTDELLAGLESEAYLGWAAESGIHPSAGPHGGQVRTFVNDALLGSLAGGDLAHPQGAAAVKELWGDGNTRVGWAVEVKVAAESQGGDGWYWYEKIDQTVYGGDVGVALCTNCHGGGVDYVLTPYPLQ